MEYDGFRHRSAGKFSVTSDHHPTLDGRRWRCEDCGGVVTARINPVECHCGGELSLAPRQRLVASVAV